MSNDKLPNQAERVISHILVGLAVGAVFSMKTGIVGFIIAGLLGAWAHTLLDAPLARLIANIA